MLWIYDQYKYFNSYSAGIDFRRQNLTCQILKTKVDPRTEGVNLIYELIHETYLTILRILRIIDGGPFRNDTSLQYLFASTTFWLCINIIVSCNAMYYFVCASRVENPAKKLYILFTYTIVIREWMCNQYFAWTLVFQGTMQMHTWTHKSSKHWRRYKIHCETKTVLGCCLVSVISGSFICWPCFKNKK